MRRKHITSDVLVRQVLRNNSSCSKRRYGCLYAFDVGDLCPYEQQNDAARGKKVYLE
jgi:hypothetical protein